ncbi:MAG: hypothetical protein ABR975_06680 [Vulcanimicrobiaceae bacterium]
MTSCLVACSGGGGGSTPPTTPGGSKATPTASPAPTPTPPTVSGDMLALAPSRGWNYQGISQGTTLTLSLYADPTLTTQGDWVLVGSGVTGAVPTVLTSAANMDDNLLGALGLAEGANGYEAVAEISYGSSSVVPGDPLLVGTTLVQGATSTPYPGVTAVVTFVGTVPGASACPTPAAGATVQYTYSTSVQVDISYVPGCGITQLAGAGGSLTLVSTATYSAIGELSIARRVASLSPLDLLRSLLGMEHSGFRSAHLLSGLFRHSRTP